MNVLNSDPQSIVVINQLSYMLSILFTGWMGMQLTALIFKFFYSHLCQEAGSFKYVPKANAQEHKYGQSKYIKKSETSIPRKILALLA